MELHRMNGQPEHSELDSDPDRDATDAENTSSDQENTDQDGPDSNGDEVTLESVQAKADENWNLYLRAVAETENIRKRAVRDVENARKYALEGFGRDMLAVVDSLEMGLAAAAASDSAVDTLHQGSAATLKLLLTTLERFGVTVIDPEGEPFNPEWHEAISMQPSDDNEPGSVLKVIQKGYSLNGRLLRPACVIVAADEA
jgi:molecular chaperone GrpE